MARSAKDQTHPGLATQKLTRTLRKLTALTRLSNTTPPAVLAFLELHERERHPQSELNLSVTPTSARRLECDLREELSLSIILVGDFCTEVDAHLDLASEQVDGALGLLSRIKKRSFLHGSRCCVFRRWSLRIAL